jgi:hypothetical protein
MARTEGTVDTVELKRNQSYFQAQSRMRVPKREEHHAELRSGTLRSTKSGNWEQFAAAGTNRRHQQSPCPLTPEIPLGYTVTSVDTVRDFFRSLTGRRITVFKMASGRYGKR